MILRPPEQDDAADILAIVRAHGLPTEWVWPEGRHGLVVEHERRVVAFAILYESLYGLVTDELWEELSPAGYRGLALLSREIERVAQRIANERGQAISLGGIVRRDRAAHIAALRKRDYQEEAVVLSKVFCPVAQAVLG